MNANINQQHMFSNKMIRALLVPIILEQLLNSIMGTADTMMVSNVGSAAISAVSLVDSINILVTRLSALAPEVRSSAAQYIGQGIKNGQMSLHDRYYLSHSYISSCQRILSYFSETVTSPDFWSS